MANTPHGMFNWNELMTRDPDRAKKFYADTIGWTFDAMPMPRGVYWIAKMGEEKVGGLFDMRGHDIPPSMTVAWMPYLAVDDVDTRLEKAVAAGATVMRPPFDVPGVGRIGILKEPGGAVVGWITPTS